MFDFNKDYEKLNTTEARDVTISLSGVIQEKIYIGNPENIFEIFKDHFKEQFIMGEAGAVFCHTMNGKQVRMPESSEQLQILTNYTNYFTTTKHYRYTYDGDLWWGNMNIALNAYSIARVPPKPAFGYPDNGAFDEVFDFTTDKLLTLDEGVREVLNKECCSFQKEEKVCKMLIAFHPQWEKKPQIMSTKCNGGQGGLHAFCEFEKRVVVKLSGICTKSPVDNVYSLMEPKSHPYERDAWDDFYRFGTFSGRLLIPNILLNS